MQNISSQKIWLSAEIRSKQVYECNFQAKMDELGNYAKTESELKERLNQQTKFLTALGFG